MIHLLVAASATMACVLYLLAAAWLWWLLLGGERRREPRLAGHKYVIPDRAMAWSALALLFGAMAAAKAGWTEYGQLDALVLVTTFTVTVTGLWSVREITREKFGNRALFFFIVVIVAAAIAVWLCAERRT